MTVELLWICLQLLIILLCNKANERYWKMFMKKEQVEQLKKNYGCFFGEQLEEAKDYIDEHYESAGEMN